MNAVDSKIDKTTRHRMLKLVWDSPILMTWVALFTKFGGLALLLPMSLTYLPIEDFIIWQVFMSVAIITTVIDFGMTPTISRVIAYAMGGYSIENIQKDNKIGQQGSGEADWAAIRKIRYNIGFIFLILSLLTFAIAGLLGTWGVSDVINESENISQAWIAWWLVISVATIRLYANQYIAFFQGGSRIADYQRLQFLASAVSIVASCFVLLAGGGLLSLVISYQFGVLLGIFLLRKYSVSLFEGKGEVKKDDQVLVKKILLEIWKPAWKSGIGVALSVGLIQLSGIVYANLGETTEVASYLLALQIIRAISTFSQAPFYTKIPVMSSLHVQGKNSEMLDLANKGMRLSYLVYVSGVLLALYFGAPLLQLIQSNVSFPSYILWSLLSLGIFFERYGAMHIQLYSITNNIIWHVANGVAGLIMIAVSFLVFPYLGVMSFPVAMVSGYVGFYSWYAAWHSHRAYKIRPLPFEVNCAIPAITILLLGLAIHYYMFN